MYDAGTISRYGSYTVAGNDVNRRVRGRGFCDLFESCPLDLETDIVEEIAYHLDGGKVWVTDSVDGRDGSWCWHTRLPEMNEDEFLELVNNNRKLYGLAESKYTQSELSKATRLLDDEMQYEI